MSKSLEALESIKQTIRLKNDGYINLFEILDFLSIEKELNAIDIIRKKCRAFISEASKNRKLSKEDINLLKEVFEND